MTTQRLSDLIIELGPFEQGGVIPHALGGMLRAVPMNELRDELIELRYVRAAAAEIHQQFEGRCAECIEACECPDEHTCTHGNVPWPCRTAKALGLA